MATGNLKLYIFDKNSVPGDPPYELKNFPLDVFRPCEVIQALYIKGNKPSASAGGTVIWKMGKCVISVVDGTPTIGQALNMHEVFSRPANGISDGSLICAWEETKPLISIK